MSGLAEVLAPHTLLAEARCSCGAEHDRRGTGEGGYSWHARHLAAAVGKWLRGELAADAMCRAVAEEIGSWVGHDNEGIPNATTDTLTVIAARLTQDQP